MALEDCYENSFDAQKYQHELNTTKNRGFTDAYLVHKPFEKEGTQNLEYALSAGSYEVSGLVLENQEYFMCKYKTYPDDEIEIFAPLNSKIEECDNDIGSIYRKDDGKYYVKFKKIITESEKELESVHSGNTNPIKLPGKLPYMTMLRVQTEDSGCESCS
jgi:putative protease